MKTLCPLLLALVLVASNSAAQEEWSPPADFPMPQRWLPVDDAGWTVVEPAADSRTIYVSSSAGSDETGKVYEAGDRTIGNDPRRPAGAVQPFKTIAAALAKARDGEPDWVLLKRGDVWHDPGNFSVRDGRSAGEPSVLAAYGAGDRPVIRGRRGRLSIGGHREGGQHVVVMDLVLYASFLDPDASDYGVLEAEKIERNMASIGLSVRGGYQSSGRHVLVENCMLRFCALDTRFPTEHLVFRRNVVVDKYPPKGHTMGMWGSRASILLEECVFDHNGWRLQRVEANRGKPGQAIPLSHNTYTADMFHTIFRNNVFTRAASINNKFTANRGPGTCPRIIVDNNLYVDGEIGISMGGNKVGPRRWVDCEITDNVMMHLGRSRPTGRSLGWGIGASDWDGGLIARNLFLDIGSPDVRNVYAIQVGSHQVPVGHNFNPTGQYDDASIWARDAVVENNVFHRVRSGKAILRVSSTDSLKNITVRANQLQLTEHATPLIAIEGENLEAVSLERNVYFSAADRDQWFALGREDLDPAAWADAVGENAPVIRKVAYPDPDRDLERYLKQIGLEPTHEAFYAALRAQCRQRWRADLTAPEINAWFRAGFGLAEGG